MTQGPDTTKPDICQQSLKRKRVKAALANLFIGDSLSMPVHWFYNPGDIIRVFGKHGITGLEAAPETHPSSIMSLHSTTGGGRARGQSNRQQEIVGDIILKGRRHFWGRPNGHYHHGMQAGENTLNAWWARLLINHLVAKEQYVAADWITDYIDFMTADPPDYPDVYAESCHRGFFANWSQGKPPLECGAVTHDTPSMGALVTVAPLALALLGAGTSRQTTSEVCCHHVWVTHPDKGLLDVVDAYVTLMDCLLCKEEGVHDTRPYTTAAAVIKGTQLDKLLSAERGDAHVVGRTYSLACYITDSWPSVCYLAAKYQDDDARALLTNTNLGGENAHRGSVLGTLVGLATANYSEQWYSDLRLQSELDVELERYLDKFYPDDSAPANIA
ncbi:MAG: ADP-ribosylglycohydrolase family protein [Granulosicoccus sp.]